MIAKMKFINITGPKADIDRVVDKYLSVYPIHLENALAELKTADRLAPFIEANPYKDVAQTLADMAKVANQGNLDIIPYANPSLKEAKALIDRIQEQSQKLNAKRDELIREKSESEALLKQLEPFKGLSLDLFQIAQFNFIICRFGRIALDYYDKFSKYVYENLNTIFYECSKDSDYVWGVYFAPKSVIVQVDAVFASMHFERFFLPKDMKGVPSEIYKTCQQKLQDIDKQIEAVNFQLANIYKNSRMEILNAYGTMHRMSQNFDIRKKAACTKERSKVFYILCGWMEEKVAKAFVKATEGDDSVFVIIEDAHKSPGCIPPTKIINKSIFKPFQLFTSMYGLPAYNELDPTKFIAITYAIMFGIMFGDVGQGAVLAIGGFLLYKFKHMDLAGIISFCGLFSVFFGFMYGSVFGFEDIFEAVWMKPMASGNMMTILMVTIGFGVALIIIAMIINMINAVRQKDPGAFLFGPNGLCGMLFYIAVLYIALAKLLPAAGPVRFMAGLVILIILCLIGIAFKEPLQAFADKRRYKREEGPVMFVLEAFFELFEIVLSFLTNTVSFIRVGAFALSHAGMMSVVMMLAGIENGVSPASIIIVIFGNILIAGLEGLIVGIQVLRLEYYEMFSRFYQGSGREFKPYNKELTK